MRNLHLLRNSHFRSTLFENIKNCYIVNELNVSKTTQCFVFTKDFELFSLNIIDGTLKDADKITDLHNFVDVEPDTSISGCNYIFSVLFVVLCNGHLIIVNIESKEVLVRRIGHDVKHVSWSPDCERTVIVTNDEQLLILSIVSDDFETLTVTSLQNEVEEQSKLVNVGWGRTETQFRGSEGKLIASKSGDELVEATLNDFNVDTCWKPNSSAFACSYVCRSEKIRKIKVFSCDGVLQNVTKSINGLSSPTDWGPSRNLITVIQKLPNKKVVSFIEENALKHGDFEISDHVEILKLCWNSNGSILALHEREENESISLWTTCNYKWYQKQHLRFQIPVTYIQWDVAIPYRLHVVLKTGVYRMYEWHFQITEFASNDGDDNLCLIAVINKKNINFTPYKLVCQPPSIPQSTFIANSEINEVIFPKLLSNSESSFHPFILYCSNNLCMVMKYEELGTHELYCINFGEADSEIEFSTPLELSSWLWLLPNNLYFSWSRTDGTYFCVSHLDSETKSIVITKMIKMDSLIVVITNYESSVIVHTEDGVLYVYQNEEFHQMNFRLSDACSRLQMLNSRTVLALSEHRLLFVNETHMWRDIVSFYWKAPFLVLITMDSELLITKIDLTHQEVKFKEVQSRCIEANSFLVTIVNDKVLLEMERGNLELISPRPFSIFRMEQMLDDENYYEVIKMFRKQRINLNVIFDHDPERFLKNIDDIVNIINPVYLCTFVTELVNENVARNMFPWKYNNTNNYNDKINVICKNLVSSLKKFDDPKLISPLIAALVRQGKLAEAANYAIKYNDIQTLLHLADPIAVYHAALQSFDLNCALKIVEHSKLDPSEYLMFIHELQETETYYRKFKIYNYLEKYSLALECLAKCEEDERFEEAIDFIRKHNLYNAALKAYNRKNADRTSSSSPSDRRYLRIVIIVADYYYEKKSYEEAAVLYDKASMCEKALECYILTGDFQSTVSALSAIHSGCSNEQVYQTLYNLLWQRNLYENAAVVALRFLKDCDKAVLSCFMAKKYCLAINAARSLDCTEYVNEVICSKLMTEADMIIKNFDVDKEHIDKLAQRLFEVKQKIKNEEEMYAEVEQLSVVSSASSESGSVSSCSSRTSSMNSNAKRLRRKERKLWNTKRNNAREEPSLLDVIKKEIQNKDKIYSAIVGDLVKALLICDEFDLSSRLKQEYIQLNQFLEDLCRKVWPLEEVTEEGGFRDIENRCPPSLTFKSCLKLL